MILWLLQEFGNSTWNFHLWRRAVAIWRCMLWCWCGRSLVWLSPVLSHSPPLLIWFAALLEVPVSTFESQVYWTDWVYFLVMGVVESQACVLSVNTVTVPWINRRTQFRGLWDCTSKDAVVLLQLVLQCVATSEPFDFRCCHPSAPAAFGVHGAVKFGYKLLCNTA